MNLNEVYLVFQIAAVVLVASGIFYLALQVRQITLQMRATARFQWVEALGQFNALTAGSLQAASVFRRGMNNPDDLSDDERMQFLVHLGQYLQIFSIMFELYKEKLLPDTQWYNCRKHMVTLMSSSGGFWVWETYGKNGLNPDFVALMESLRADQEVSYDITNKGLKRADT